ncbi:hypothetical protein D3C77_687570 [compost metagenome]
MLDTVLSLEQGTVEHPDCLGIGKVDTGLAVWIGDHELAQFRATLDQLGEVVTALVAVARMQGRFVRCRHFKVR